jgi:bifunctional DNA-binding transcriptional regulator/antitoxin component of YhaV-PrlF toxin-antitoxin module
MCRDVSGCVGMCRDVSQCGGNEWCKLPLDQRVVFKTILRKKNQLQVPNLVRRQFKLETSEVLRVTVSVTTLLRARESFLTRMHKDGRIVIPYSTIALLKHDKSSLDGYIIEVTLEPT